MPTSPYSNRLAGLVPVYTSPVSSTALLLPTLAFAGNIARDETGATWLWSGTAYVLASTGTVSSVAGRSGAVVLTKTDVALANVDNTSDVNKPVSTAQAAADTAVQTAAATDATTKANARQATLVSLTNIRTVNGNTLLGSTDLVVGGAANNAATIAVNTTLTAALHDSRTVEVTASCTLTLNLDATDGWVPPSGSAAGSSLYLQCAAGVVVTWAGTATISPTAGASYSAGTSVARLIGLDHSLTANTWIVTSVQVGVLDVNGTDITATRAIAESDFGAGVLRINAAGVVALTLPTVASLAFTATPGKVRVLLLQVIGAGIPTFAGATASTTINGVAGPTTVLPVGGAPVRYGHYVLTQLSAGADAWSLE